MSTYTDITLSINDDQIDTLALSLGYYTDIPDPSDPSSTIPNPETVPEYIERWMIERLSLDYRKYSEASAVGGAAIIPLDVT